MNTGILVVVFIRKIKEGISIKVAIAIIECKRTVAKIKVEHSIGVRYHKELNIPIPINNTVGKVHIGKGSSRVCAFAMINTQGRGTPKARTPIIGNGAMH